MYYEHQRRRLNVGRWQDNIMATCLTFVHFTFQIYLYEKARLKIIENLILKVLPRVYKNLKLLIWIDFVRCLFRYNIQIVFLQESKVFPCFRELSFLHTFTNIPVHKSSLGIHQVILCVDTFSKNTTNSYIVPNHGNIFLRQGGDVSANKRSRNFVKTDLETCWTPLNEADFVVLLQPLYGSVGLL